MNLRSVNFLEEYRSDEEDIVGKLYVPALESSILYRRAVGYFTSNSIMLAMRGIVALIANGGKMQLIASPHLTEEDIDAIESGYKSREDVVDGALERAIPDANTSVLPNNQWECLAWMIAKGALEIKIALPNHQDLHGIYHEKLGIFTDTNFDSVAFSGSANETSGGLIGNFEAVDVFTSWGDTSRTLRKIRNFERLWDNQTRKVEIVNFPDAAKQRLLVHLRSEAPTRINFESIIAKRRFSIPVNIALRDYQEAAITNWIKARGKGVLKMATGSGKTITGLAAAQRIFQSGQLKALIIICPYIHLVTQWSKICRDFSLEPILCYQNSNDWLPRLSKALLSENGESGPLLVVITTATTFSLEPFQSRLRHFPSKTMLLADEVHNLGASGLKASLPQSIPIRLGLSATPERWFDEDGTMSIFNYFGPVLEPIFTLKDALDKGALCKYRYYPIPVFLDEEEMLEYRAISKKIAKLAGSKDDKVTQAAEALMIKRARLVATASGKLLALRELMKAHTDFDHFLFYCGDGTVESDDGDSIRHVDQVSSILSRELGARIAKFTSANTMQERTNLLQAFDKGDLQGLVAIRCLDEGVDVPSTKTAVILASSTNPRQFIQRRGRILRKSPGKSRAEIYDMIIIPPLEDETTASEKSLARKEVLRYSEFASLAENAPEAKKLLWKIQEHFHITDI